MSPLAEESICFGHVQSWHVALASWRLASSAEAALSPLMEVIREVGPEGSNNRKAQTAFEQLALKSADEIPQILSGMKGACPVAANWIRAAVDEISKRELSQNRRLPTNELETFLLDVRNDPRGRQLAYDLLVRVDATSRNRLLPRLLDDPSVDLRRQAVTKLMKEIEPLAKSKMRDEADELYRKVLSAARDRDQIDDIAKHLRELGETVDLPRHFGFLTHWKVIGPFPNENEKGFDAIYPPERVINPTGEYEVKEGKIRWRDITSTDDYGLVELHKTLGTHKDVAGYATTTFSSDRERAVELRFGSYNAWKIWLNGELVFARREAFTGQYMDHYRLPVRLRSGDNTILIKLCVNTPPQPQVPLHWQFQLRVCDQTGTAIHSTRSVSLAR